MLTAGPASADTRLTKAALLRLICCALLAAALLAGNAPAAKGAGAGVDPNFVANVRLPAEVLAVAVQPDGKVVIGGAFTSVGGVKRTRVARLNSDGTLDTSFLDPDVNGSVGVIEVQPDGKVVIGGAFTTVSGEARRLIARLNPDGSIDTSFNPDVNGPVTLIAVQSDGKVVIGGAFTAVGGAARDGVARLNPDGSLDASFIDPKVNRPLAAVAVRPDGKILIGGDFTSVGGVARSNIARLNPDGTLDTPFNPNVRSPVRAIVLQPDGKILIGGGAFTADGRTVRDSIMRLNPDGSADTSFFHPNPDNLVFAIAVQPDGKILIGGSATSPSDGSRRSFTRLNPDGSRDTPSRSQLFASVFAIALQPDGKIIIRYVSTGQDRVVRNSILRLNSDGEPDSSFVPLAEQIGSVSIVALQPDGKILVGGNFTTVGGVARGTVARLNPDGSVNPSFNLGLSFFRVQSIVAQPDGKVYVKGFFTDGRGFPPDRVFRLNPRGLAEVFFNPDPNVTNTVDSFAVQPDGKVIVSGSKNVQGGGRFIVRLNPDASLDTSFNSSANRSVGAIAVQPDGKILTVGGRTFMSGDRVTRLNPDGSLDPSFTGADANGPVSLVAVQADGKLVIGGDFTTVGGAARGRVARLNPDGSLDASFTDPDVNGAVHTVAFQSDGKLVIGGNFTSVGGAARRSIARLNPDGSVDASFHSPDTDGVVNAFALQPDGKVVIGGGFTTVNGLPRIGLARLLPTPAISLSSSANPSAAGQLVTFTASVTPQPAGPPTPTGTVTFRDGDALLATVPLDSAGRASFSASGLAAGAHAITASYSGDQNFAPAVASLSQRVEASGLRLSDSEYSVSEGVGRLVVTVVRTDASSGGVSVNFAASDGTASSRSDYARASGTLTFAVGETSQTFTLFIADDAHVEGDETLTLTLSNTTGDFGLVEPSTATVTIRDDDTSPSAPNPIDSAEFFVRQHYRDFLGRDPDAAGLRFWTQGIESCGADQACRAVKRIDTSAAFFLSIEFQQTGYLVYRAYGAALGTRRVGGHVPLTLNEFMTDVRRVGAGVVVNEAGWEAQIEANKVAYFDAFVQRPAFLAVYPNSLTPAQYVDALNANTDGSLSTSERDALVSDLTSGAKTRAQALRALAEDADFRAREQSRAFVLMQYFGYLRRNPSDPPELTLDFQGYDFWLGKLEDHGGDWRAAEMVKSFLISTEYRRRFGQP